MANRYQIATKRSVRPVAYRFKPSNSIYTVSRYMQMCADNEVAFDASNMNTMILENALIKYARAMNYPIILKDEHTARVLSMTHGFKKIYTVNKIPDTVCLAICYWDMHPETIPARVNSILTIMTHIKEQNGQ